MPYLGTRVPLVYSDTRVLQSTYPTWVPGYLWYTQIGTRVLPEYVPYLDTRVLLIYSDRYLGTPRVDSLLGARVPSVYSGTRVLPEYAPYYGNPGTIDVLR